MHSAPPIENGSAGLIAGVDTHTDTHTLAILTSVGQVISTETFTADHHGYQQLICALEESGTVEIVGVEGTNSYGAGLARTLSAAGYRVAEVLRPARQVRRMHGKSDPVTAGGNPSRIRSEAAFASLCGAAPIPASSGKTNRHRLNRGGDRRGNSALHRIALVRMRHDPTTRAYVERRLGENKTKKDIIRSLKRAIAREVYKALTRPHESQSHAPAGAELAAQRKAQHLSLSDAARALHTWPARISDIEKHHRPLPDLTSRYHQWLSPA